MRARRGAQSSQVETVQSELRAFVTELNAALAARDRAALERRFSLPGGTGVLTFSKAADGAVTDEFQRTNAPS